MPDYTSIFETAGAFVRVYNQLKQFSQDDLTISSGGNTFRSIDNLASRFVTLLNDSADERRHLTVVDRLRALGSTVDASWQGVRSVFDEFLTTNVANDLGTGGTAPDILTALYRSMFSDSESIQQNAVSASSVSADANNAGNGNAYVSLTVANPDDTTRDSQLARNESVFLSCEVDSPNDGVAEGNERWRVRSNQGISANATTIPVTSGATENSRNLIIDGSFSDFNGGAFDNYSASGAAIFSQNVADTLFNNTALAINGSGVATLEQVLSDRSTPPPGGVLMALGIHRKVNSLSAGTITLRLVADSVPLAGTITINTSTSTGAWGHEAVFIYVPRQAFPDELKLEIVTDASFNGDVLLDGLSVGLVNTIGHGISLAVFQGVEAFVRLPAPDRFSFTTTSDDAGIFINFFRDVYGLELVASGSPTVSDTLAT